MTTKKKKNLLSILLFFLFLFLYSFRAESSFFVNTDFTRDLYNILKISRGNLTLLGPYLSFGYYTGPFYYYLFTPLFTLTHSSISSIFLLNSILFSFSLSFFFFTLSSRQKTLPSLLSTLILGLFPFFLTTARHPGNGFTYLSLLLLFLTFTHLNPPSKKINLLFFGFFTGIIINFHPASLLIIIPSFIYLITTSKNKKNLIFSLLGITLSFLPLLLFETRHSFLITQGFLHHPSRQSAISYSMLPRLKFLLSSLFPLHLLLPLLSLLLYLISSKKTKSQIKILLLPLSSLILYLLLPISKLETHYLLPLFLSLSFFSILFLLKTLPQKTPKLLTLFILLPFLLSFPSSAYQPSSSTLDHHQQAIDYVLENKIIPPNQSFNLIAINGPQHLTPVGHGYRFFFLLNHQPALETTQYQQPNNLLIFSTDPNFSPTNLNCWETQQFGQNLLKHFQKHSLENLDIYFIPHQQP